MKKLVLLLYLVASLPVFAQYMEPKSTESRQVEVFPEFPGGMGAFYKYLADNMHYPADARQLGIQGKVYIVFEIDEEGHVDTASVKTVRGLFSSLDQESERVIKESPRWNPGQQDGEKVRTRMVLPVIFALTSPEPFSPGTGKRKKTKKTGL